ncbi:transcription factor Tfb4 [Viridothelium virens]|uniref:General transcription and DNA repair factor IIH subunit TFB4 n=1 Tax=Viridothelium virens TaxID=1048519 RepID=A0A6A6HR67_VIRVR|nr:transcription factor Tfb4 [Viridothelium virens]
MNAIDGTERQEASSEGPPPALLVIILDTNPYAWTILRETITLLDAVANLQIFINAHLAFSHANQVAVIASHTDRAVWLYPTPARTRKNISNGAVPGPDGDTSISNGNAVYNSNKYKPFAQVEEELMASLRSLMSTTDPSSLESTTSTMMAGALSTALCYISKTSEAYNATRSTDPNPSYTYDAPPTADPNDPNSPLTGLQSRIFIFSVSTSLATQYIPLMNGIFAAQRLRVAIDVLSLNPSTSPSAFLQQAADATNGIFYAPPRPNPPNPIALLPTLLSLFVHDQTSRRALYMPTAAATSASSSSSTASTAINFQAACFCHRRTVTIGYVCSICLSIFCEECGVVRDGVCLTCGTRLRLGRYGREPKVVAGRKKKKRGGEGEGGTASGSGTPLATPGLG